MDCNGTVTAVSKLEQNDWRRPPISRVLSWTIIHLRYTSPYTFSDLPGPSAGHAVKGPYLVLLRVGFTIAVECCHPRGALLPHRFTLTVSPSRKKDCLGGLLSVALSVGFRRPDVIWHPALWSPDFPPSRKRDSDCLAISSGAKTTNIAPECNDLLKRRFNSTKNRTI